MMTAKQRNDQAGGFRVLPSMILRCLKIALVWRMSHRWKNAATKGTNPCIFPSSPAFKPTAKFSGFFLSPSTKEFAVSKLTLLRIPGFVYGCYS